jgi:hypothetical protein
MVTISFDVLGQMGELSTRLQKQATYAAMRALNQAGYDAKQATQNEIRRVFDRPTPWVQNSVRYTKATRDKLQVQVDFDKWGNKSGVTAKSVLQAEVEGGRRKLKRFERALQAAGAMPPGYMAVPGKGMKLDAYGNIPGKALVEILAYFRAFPEQGYKANSTARTKQKKWKGNAAKGIRGYAYFAIGSNDRSGLPPGIWRKKNYSSAERSGVGHLAHDAAQAMLIFVKNANYRKRLNFYEFAERAARDSFDRNFPVFLAQAMATAR